MNNDATKTPRPDQHMRYCGNCGTPHHAGARFCGNCGAKIPVATTNPTVTQEDPATPALINSYYTLNADYGLSPNKPIRTRDLNDQLKYLRTLRGENGEVFKWIHKGTVQPEGARRPVDVYDIYINEKLYKTLYFCNYGVNADFTTIPMGFSCMNEPTNTEPEKTSSGMFILLPVILLFCALVAVMLYRNFL